MKLKHLIVIALVGSSMCSAVVAQSEASRGIAPQKSPATLKGAQVAAEGDNAEKSSAPKPAAQKDLKIAQVQALLDRAGFSPGEIDGQQGANYEVALKAFRQANKLKSSGRVDDSTLEALLRAAGVSNPEEAFTRYQIPAQDPAGEPVGQIPSDMAAKAKLPALGYATELEALGERFHAEPELLKAMNPDAKFVAGEEIVVPNVTPFITSAGTTSEEKPSQSSNEKSGAEKKNSRAATGDRKKTDTPDKEGSGADANGASALSTADSNLGTAARIRQSQVTKELRNLLPKNAVIRVSKKESALRVEADGGELFFFAPVTTGSEHDPLPIGEWKVNGVERNPKYFYNPDLFWDAKPKDEKARLAPGPNNPVGVVWIDLSKEHYGLHGTPEPGKVGHAESHGCVRLTNWDATLLAALVKPGTKVVFEP